MELVYFFFHMNNKKSINKTINKQHSDLPCIPAKETPPLKARILEDVSQKPSVFVISGREKKAREGYKDKKNDKKNYVNLSTVKYIQIIKISIQT